MGAEFRRILFAGSGGSEEALWAVPSGPGEFRVVSTPLLALGIAPGDVVRASRGGGGDAYVYEGTVSMAASRVFIVYPPGGGEMSPGAMAALQGAVSACACDAAVLGRLMAACVPSARAEAFLAALERGEAAGRWSFAEGTAGQER